MPLRVVAAPASQPICFRVGWNADGAASHRRGQRTPAKAEETAAGRASSYSRFEPLPETLTRMEESDRRVMTTGSVGFTDLEGMLKCCPSRPNYKLVTIWE